MVDLRFGSVVVITLTLGFLLTLWPYLLCCAKITKLDCTRTPATSWHEDVFPKGSMSQEALRGFSHSHFNLPVLFEKALPYPI